MPFSRDVDSRGNIEELEVSRCSWRRRSVVENDGRRKRCMRGEAGRCHESEPFHLRRSSRPGSCQSTLRRPLPRPLPRLSRWLFSLLSHSRILTLWLLLSLGRQWLQRRCARGCCVLSLRWGDGWICMAVPLLKSGARGAIVWGVCSVGVLIVCDDVLGYTARTKGLGLGLGLGLRDLFGWCSRAAR